MKNNTPKRIAIIGLPGSGKSTFANRLGKLLDIPVHHLDKPMFLEDGSKRDKNEFIAIQQQMIDSESWIIEGCSLSTIEMRFSQADLVIYLAFPRLLCVWRVFKRAFTKNPFLSETGCLNSVNWILLKYIWNFSKDKTAQIEQVRNRYPETEFIVLNNSKDVANYCKTFE